MSRVIVGKRLRAALQSIQDTIAREGAGRGRKELEAAMDRESVRDLIVSMSLATMARTGLLVPCIDKPKRKVATK
jgi:hypothetical protein